MFWGSHLAEVFNDNVLAAKLEEFMLLIFKEKVYFLSLRVANFLLMHPLL